LKKRKTDLIGSLQLTDPRFLGNDSASDEPEDRFLEYAYERPEVAAFSSLDKKIVILHAPKGSGKSALCILSKRSIRSNYANVIPIMLYADKVEHWTVSTSDQSNLSQGSPTDLPAWRSYWNQRILRAIAAAACPLFQLKWEESVAKAISDRNSFDSKDDHFCVLLRNSAVPSDDSGDGSIKEWSGIVVFIDEVDANFTGTEVSCERIAGFFLAIQDIDRQFKDIFFKLTIRPNVWAQVHPKYTSLLTFRQYLMDLLWDTDQLGELIRYRIDSYLQKKAPDFADFEGDSLDLLFDDDRFDLGDGNRGPVKVLAMLASFRPRWLIELLRSAGANAAKTNDRVSMDDIKDGMFDFGSARTKDLAAEFRNQCNNVEDLIHSLSGAKVKFKGVNDLLGYLGTKLSKMQIRFVGFDGYDKRESAARLLVLMDVVHGRYESTDGAVYKHFKFSDIGGFPKNREFYSDLSWEIHPMFRELLRLDNGEYIDQSLEHFRKTPGRRKSRRRRKR
jgi:hypothetical protein